MDVTVGSSLLDAMLDFALERHPREIVLLLRGRVERGSALIEDFLLPPVAVGGRGFAEFSLRLLPIDFTIIGTAHSHPSGAMAPSVGDLNNFYGRVMLILAHPYVRDRVVAFNPLGERMPIKNASQPTV